LNNSPISKRLLVASAAVLLALAVATPRKAHAIAAALVQVANTSSAPAVIESVSESAQQIVRVHCALRCQAVGSDGRLSAALAYPVPPGQTLVVNAIDLANYQVGSGGLPTAPCSGSVQEQLTAEDANQQFYLREDWLFTGGLTHLVYPSGVLFAGGTMLQGLNHAASDNCLQYVDLYGYLSSN